MDLNLIFKIIIISNFIITGTWQAAIVLVFYLHLITRESKIELRPDNSDSIERLNKTVEALQTEVNSLLIKTGFKL